VFWRKNALTIPNGLRSIGESAFEGCTSRTSIVIGDGVTDVGGRAFYGRTGLTGLTEVVFPNSVSYLGDSQARGIEVTQAGKVIYQSAHSAVGRFPDPGDEELAAGPSRNFQVLDPPTPCAEAGGQLKAAESRAPTGPGRIWSAWGKNSASPPAFPAPPGVRILPSASSPPRSRATRCAV
jgi:BspA type Leucine rich repeat region (6 copies)